MRNWKTITIAAFLCLTAATAVALAAYTPNNVSPALAAIQQAARIAPMVSHAPHMRVAQSCIAHNQTCTINGTPCCNSTDSCKGTFPNTTCQ